MSGFVTDTIGNAGAPMNLDTLPSATSERVNPFALTEQIGRAIGDAAARYGTVDEYGRPLSAPEPMVPKAQLDADWGVNGPTPALSWHPQTEMPDSVAKAISEAKRDEIARANAAARSPGGVGNFLEDMGYGMLDPVGIAASVLPVFGEARIGALLGRAGIDLGESVAGRAGLRAATGVADATAATAPLVALRYGLSRQEGADYSMHDAALDLAYGGLLGGLLHPLAGALGDLAGRAPRPPGEPETAPESVPTPDDQGPMTAAAAAAMHAATAAVMEDRPVTLDPLQARLDALARQAEFARRMGDARAADAARAEAEGLPRSETTSSFVPPELPRLEGTEIPGASPVSLLEFLAWRGGIKDDGGELASMGIDYRASAAGRRLVRKSSGRSLDYAREIAEEAGYLPPNSDINDLLDAIGDETAGIPRYSMRDTARLAEAVSGGALERDRADRAQAMREEALPGAREDVSIYADEAGLRLTPEELDHAGMLAVDGMHPEDAVRSALLSTQERDTAMLALPGVREALGAPAPEDAAAIDAAEAAATAPPLAEHAPSPELAQHVADAEAGVAAAREAGLLTAEDERELSALSESDAESRALQAACEAGGACIIRGLG